jgi:sorbitol/mannitol transport system permease protein
VIVSWEWIPFSFLILVTALKPLDREQREAAAIDGAGPIAQFFFVGPSYQRRLFSPSLRSWCSVG